MRAVDGVKAYTASDTVDVLPTACAFIAVMCENRNRYLRLKIEQNQTKFDESKPIQPYSILSGILIYPAIWPQ